VTARGDGNFQNWEAGILQSISAGSWRACYSNGHELRYQVDTGNGPIRDSESTESLFARRGYPLQSTALPSVYEVNFSNHDSPPVTFLTEFSGDAIHPHESTGNGLGQLRSTEGKVDFQAFLAVISSEGAIVTLSECHWILTWDGTYDFASKTWRRTDPNAVIRWTQSDLSRTYENPRAFSTSFPFRLDLPIANDRVEVWTPSGWVACRDGLPHVS